MGQFYKKNPISQYSSKGHQDGALACFTMDHASKLLQGTWVQMWLCLGHAFIFCTQCIVQGTGLGCGICCSM